MDNIVVNELKIFYPEGFHVMDALERSKLNMLGNDAGEMVFDPDRHMTISIGWRRIGLAARLNSVGDILKQTEAGISKGMQPYGYKFLNKAPLKIDEEPADSFCYEYTAQDIEMYGATIVVKHGKVLYNIHLYSRKELLDSNMETWKEIVDNARWI
ncbi:MAG: hypothetical protein IIY97_04335 [Firmicutes bacterium]|nr:hypothetical protein [Bacillota bacterium]